MPIELTKEQRLAVEKNGNILVSAAAGSGKTAVLVERVINKLCSKTEPVSADRLLIVTFTNAAAAEMRGRIEKRLDEKCAENPDDTGLLLQKHLLSSAKICTIDSFCIDFVRENFEKLGISPDFTISDNSALRPINERVLSEIIERYFKENNPQFIKLLDLVGAEFDESNFSQLVLSLYDYSRQLPFPDKWFDSIVADYDNGSFKADNTWCIFAISKVQNTVINLKNNLSNAVDLLSVDSKMADKYLPCFMIAGEKLDNLSDIVKTNDWDAIYNKISSFSLPSLPIVRGSNDIPEIKASKEIYDYISKKISEELTKLFYADSDFISSQFKELYPSIKLLCEILKEFSVNVYNAYLEENTFTFHNTEALALQLLCHEKDGEIVINPEAEEFLSLFDEVCVDEYQDTNDLQNMLFYVLSNKDSKLFAVGDVKQSIYGFRGANPEHFLEKKSNHTSVNDAKVHEPIKIILGNNFRSRPEVCDFINFFFSLTMTSETGSIVYDEEEMLVPKGEFPPLFQRAVSMDIIENDSEEGNKIIEARQIAQFIKNTIAGGEIIRIDKVNKRTAKYSDFTILLRSMKNNAGIIAEELRRQGIPVNFSAEGFCEYTEIAVMLSLLKVIDNPRSDVELLAVMMSPIFGFTAEDMAKIRIENRKCNLYSAVTLFAEKGDQKTQNFLAIIRKFRLLAVTNTLPSLLSILYEETGFLNTVMAYNDGVRRHNNLLLLLQYAEGYTGSISGFVNHILKQSEKGIKSAAISNGDNAVRIMSIHSSKGLQFPVCIIANTSSAFNNTESREGNVYSSKYGLGFKYFDEEDKKPYTTLAREAILSRIKQERLEEELRLFYVAMTRTQDILHFTAVTSNIEKKSAEIRGRLLGNNSTITTDFWERTRSYFDWLLAVLMLHPDGKAIRPTGSAIIPQETSSHIDLRVINANSIPNNQSEYSNETVIANNGLFEIVKQNIEYSYPFERLFSIGSKASASVLANKAESEKYSFTAKPSFMSKDGLTASGRGTAMHKVMEFFDFSMWENPKEELNRLYEWQFITETEANAIDISCLESFFKSDVFKRIKNSETVKREMRFLTELPAKLADNELGAEYDNENIIVQGAVDVCFVEDDGVVILDFKTDRTDNPQDLINSYKEQLNIYSLACEKIFGKPVKEKIIYSFHLKREIKL